MGANLAKVVLSPLWAGDRLTPPARVLFAHMAVTAMDKDKPPTYFGGRQAMVLALFGELPDEQRERENRYRYVRRLVEQIRAEGGLVLLNADTIRNGTERAVYEVRVMGRPEGLTDPPGGGLHRPSPGGSHKPSGGGSTRPGEGGLHRPSQGDTHQETPEDLPQEIPAVGPTTYVSQRPSSTTRRVDPTCRTCHRTEQAHHHAATTSGDAHPFETEDPA